MRVEPYTVGSYVHVIKRGARGLPIVQDENDRWRFFQSLYYLNDKFFDQYWTKNIYDNQTVINNVANKELFRRPLEWPERIPLVSILAYTLMPNHIHLLLKEIEEGGISIFMQKLGQSMTNHFNEKYDSKGSIFQGSYKGKNIEEDQYLRYAAMYIMVKNVFELFPGGLIKAKQNFEKAWKFAEGYQFSSFRDYAKEQHSLIIDKDILGQIFCGKADFKKFAQEVIEGGKWEKEKK